MSTTELSSNEFEMDRLLSDFYMSELPNPFPALRLPSEMPMPVMTKEPTRERRNAVRAKLSIAVSVALLIGGGWYLSGRMSDAPEKEKLKNGANIASPPKAMKDAMQK